MNKKSFCRDTKLIIIIVLFLLMLLAVGILLILRMRSILSTTLGSQVAYHAEAISDIAYERINSQFDEMQNLISYMNIEDEGSTGMEFLESDSIEGIYGLSDITGKALVGKQFGSAEFSGIVDAFRGYESISYSENSGLLFSLPVYHDKNVKYVLNRLYTVKELENEFDINSYDGAGDVAIVTNESELVVPFNNNSMLYSRILTSEKGQNALRSIRKQMSADSFGAKAVKYDKVYYYMFESEIGDTGLFILGFVPAEYISINVWHIVLLVGWVFFFMATILLVFVYYTYKTESKAFEANALVKTYKENESTENINVLFLSNMAKEFKAPLNSIINMNEMILKDPSELLVKEYASKIKASGIALNSTINDVIDFAKLKNGSLEITPEQYDLKNEIETLYKMTSILAEEKNLELKVEINKSIPRILYGDIRRLRGVILNLITNAIKYTERGEVLIRFWYVKTDINNIMLNVSVKDTGIGIKQEDIGKLYAPYEKINEISKDVLSGTGLGLNIAKEVLGLMGSSLKIESEYGSGSEFSFEVNQTVIEWEPIGKIAMNRIKK